MKITRVLAVFICVFMLILITTCGQQEKKVLRFGNNPEYPPFSYMTGSAVDGIDADIAKKIADKMGWEYEIIAMEFQALIPALASNKIDAAISAITITPQRAQVVDFSAPYYTTNQVIVAKNDSPIVINKVEDLGNYTIGTLKDTTGHMYIVENLLEKDLMSKNNLKLYPTNLEAIGELLAGNIDFVIIDETAALGYSKLKPIKEAFIIKTNEQYGIAMQKGKALNDKINKALNELIASGEVKRIIDSHINN